MNKPKDVDGASVQSIVTLLERIAVALERLAGDRITRPETTEFPWHEMSKRTINAAMQLDDKDYRYPFSCEALVAIGRERFLEERNFGDLCADEIAAVLDQFGFHQWNRDNKPKERRFRSPVVMYETVPSAGVDSCKCSAATFFVRHTGEEVWRQCEMPVKSGEFCKTHAGMDAQVGRISYAEFKSR